MDAVLARVARLGPLEVAVGALAGTVDPRYDARRLAADPGRYDL
ncbi:hypothetical protein [Kitasatospora purpeofusca]|nr:hypothetical protein OIP63_22695 [Kitasatospora purpeofusca]